MAQAIFEEAKITNIEMKSHALLEIAPGIHSPVCPYLVEFSACVPPALHMHYVQKAKKYFNYCPRPDLNPEPLTIQQHS